MTASIITQNLTKYYGKEKIAAINGLSLQVMPGEVYGFLGANGAGKTTTIRILMDFLRPSSGSATIMGLDSVKDSVAAKTHIGYLSGDVALYPKPTGRQLLDYLGKFQKPNEYRKVLEKRFDVELDKPIGQLSKGNRQKIGILQAMMHQPSVLILDEPTSGIDPLMQEAFYKTVDECRQNGAAILMSSHNLAEAERICDRIGIIKQGKLIKEQVIAQDTALGTVIFRVTFASSSDLKQAKSTKGLKFISQTDKHTALIKPSGKISAALKALSQFDISELGSQKIDLEGEFLEYYGDGS